MHSKQLNANVYYFCHLSCLVQFYRKLDDFVSTICIVRINSTIFIWLLLFTWFSRLHLPFVLSLYFHWISSLFPYINGVSSLKALHFPIQYENLVNFAPFFCPTIYTVISFNFPVQIQKMIIINSIFYLIGFVADTESYRQLTLGVMGLYIASLCYVQ